MIIKTRLTLLIGAVVTGLTEAVTGASELPAATTNGMTWRLKYGNDIKASVAMKVSL